MLGKKFKPTFAPVAKLNFVHFLISLATAHSWPLHQLDVKNTFLHVDLLESIYMDPPPSFQAEGEYVESRIDRLSTSDLYTF